MKVLNISKRTFNQPKSEISKLLETLSTKNDKIWPFEKWPAMRFKEGLKKGARGGHGIIRYSIEDYQTNESIQFRFSQPNGFNGIHKFEIEELARDKTQLKHTIEMDAKGSGLFTWLFIVRPLHDALLQDSLDKVDNYFLEESDFVNRRKSKWSLWVRLLRRAFKSKS